MNVRAFLVLAGAAAALWSVRRWQLAIQVGMLLVILEGAIRKWLLPGSQDLVYFAKDIFFLAGYLGFFVNRHRLRLRYPQMPFLYTALALSAAFGLLQVFNPQLPNLLVGVLGLKAYFLYVPLLFGVPAVFPDDLALARFLKRYVLLAIPVALLAVAQFFSSPGSVINTYARPTDPGSISTFGSSSYVRATGTFAYITGFTSYLLISTVLILIILTTTKWRFRRNIKVFVALGMTFLGMLTSGSRGPIFLLALVLPIYWWLGVVRERQGGVTLARLVIGLGVLVAILGSTGDQAITAFGERASGSTDTMSRFLAPFQSPIDAMSSAGLTGSGIGATHQAAPSLARDVAPYSWLRGASTEAESGRVMLELGPVGFFLIYFVRIGLAVFAFRQVFRLQTIFHRAIAVSALLLFLVEIPGGVVFDVTAAVYYWFLAGLLFLAVRLDQPALATASVVPEAKAGMLATRASPRHGTALPVDLNPRTPLSMPPVASSRSAP